MKKKIDLFWYWFIFVVAFVLCFFAINDKKVNAYYFDNNGNLVSDNLLNLPTTPDITTSCGTVGKVSENNTITIVGTSTCATQGPIYSNNLNLLLEPGTYTLYAFKLDTLTGWGGNVYLGPSEWSTLFNVEVKSPLTTYYDTVVITESIVVNFFRSYTQLNGVYNAEFQIMLAKGDYNSSLSFEPYGTWYSESNLNTEKEISYEDGYNAGIVVNNTAPSFYFDDITSLMQFRVLGNTSYVYVDNMSNVTGYNSIINFSELLGVQYGSAYFSQYYWTTLSLLNTINVSDTLVFNFSDIANAPDFSTKTAITFSSSSSCYDIGNGGTICPNYATFTYEELLQNNFTLKLEDFGELDDITEIDTIGVQLYYNGTRSFGLLTLEDVTLTGDITSDFEIGYRVGFITGEESGVIKGETIGYDKGYNEGYRKASQVVKDPGNNTLVGMVSVLMGMPVNMLISIYDFDFLGINLAEFFFSLITLLVSIWLIKKLL